MRMRRILIWATPGARARDANANHSHLDSHLQPPSPEPIVPIERVFERTFRLAERGEASDLRGEASQKVLRFL